MSPPQLTAQFPGLETLFGPFFFVQRLIWAFTLFTNIIWWAPTLIKARYTYTPKPLGQLKLAERYYRAPAPGDMRTPCPGLNTLANHGIIHRNGKKINPIDLFHALRDYYSADFFTCFSLLSAALQVGLSDDGYTLDLGRIGLHNFIEHDASISRPDSGWGKQECPDMELVRNFCEFGRGEGQGMIGVREIARFRVLRERECQRHNPQYELSGLHPFITRGEPALILDVFGDGSGTGIHVSTTIIETWMGKETFPAGYVPRLMRAEGASESLTLKKSLRMNIVVGYYMWLTKWELDRRPQLSSFVDFLFYAFHALFDRRSGRGTIKDVGNKIRKGAEVAGEGLEKASALAYDGADKVSGVAQDATNMVEGKVLQAADTAQQTAYQMNQKLHGIHQKAYSAVKA